MAIAIDATGKYLTIVSSVLDANAPYSAGGYVQRTTSDANAIRVFGTDDAGGDFSNYESIKVDWFGNPAGLAFTIGGTFVGPTYGTTNISAGTWYHLMVVRESATSLKLYVNGSLEVTLTTSISGRAATARMVMGALGGGAAGASIGTALGGPGIGTGIGALIGLILMIVGQFSRPDLKVGLVRKTPNA